MHNAIIFVHKSPFPRYLYYNLENTLAFNPETPVYLICDHMEKKALEMGVQLVLFNQLKTPLMSQFKQNYQHISCNSKNFELFCFLRWFYVQSFLEKYSIEKALHLDSDCMIFASFKDINKELSPYSLAISQGGSPHLTFIQSTLVDFLNRILSRFQDKKYLKERRDILQKSLQGMGPALPLSDMTLFEEHIYHTKQAVDYSTLPLEGVLEHNLNLSEGYLMSKNKKCIYWKLEQGKIIPFLKRNLGGKKRAYSLHFQGRCKKYMRRFNTLKSIHAKNSLMPYLKKLCYNAQRTLKII